ncbi:hypothetical protein CAPTEDRAFT_146719, partial [Capitella teleta]
ARERNIKFNEEKLILKQRSISFYGHVITNQGVKPDPQKVKAIQAMEPPTDVTTMSLRARHSVFWKGMTARRH